jgi:quinol monooxygenase YgiN
VIILIGYFEVPAESRDQFLAARSERMAHSRNDEGCFEFSFCADPIVENQVILVERWESKDALYRHLARTKAEGPVANSPQPTAPPRIMVYDVVNESPYVPL